MRRACSIRTRLTAASAVLLLLVAAAQLMFGLFFAQPYLLAVKKGEIQDFFRFIRDSYTDDPTQLHELLREGEFVNNIRVLITDGDEILYSSQPMDRGNASPLFFGWDQLEFSPEPTVTEVPSRGGQDGQEALLCLAGSFTYQGEPRYVALWVLVEAVESSITALNQVSLAIVAFALLIGVAASVLLARSISRPIQRVQQVSRQVADLDFSARADEQVPIRELADLGRSVNRMSDHLCQTIEELRVANARLQEDVDRQRRLEQMRREFIANVSHEMKTPLCLLQMYAENLRNNVEGIDKDEYCDVIVDEAEQLSSMVGSMLELSAIENGLSSMAPVPLDLGELSREVLERLAPVLAHCRVTGPGEGSFPVLGDRKYLGLALNNFLTNAAAHTPQGGWLRVELEREAGTVRLTVANQGAGIPPDRLDRVWDSFYKVDEARVRSTGEVHAGLGLAIVKNVIQRHGGRCGVVNLPDGVAFSFSLPVRTGDSVSP